MESKLSSMHAVGNLIPSLIYLLRIRYVTRTRSSLYLTGEGIRATETLYKKFLAYLNKDKNEEVYTWINSLNRHKNSSWELIRDAYFYIETQPPIEKLFKNYLEEVGDIENVINLDVYEHDLGSIIDDIFINMSIVNKLFQHKFSYRLFCPSVESQSFMHKATKGREVNLVELVAAVGSVLDGICKKEIERILGNTKGIKGSINKFEALLKKE